MVADRVMEDSHVATDFVIDDCILSKVANQMWEKELLDKHQKPYLTQLASSYSTHMYLLKQDAKEDDGVVTPRHANDHGDQNKIASNHCGTLVESRDSFESNNKSQGRYRKTVGHNK